MQREAFPSVQFREEDGKDGGRLAKFSLISAIITRYLNSLEGSKGGSLNARITALGLRGKWNNTTKQDMTNVTEITQNKAKVI